MPDVYSHLTELDPSTIEMLAQAMEIRAADPVRREFVGSYMSRLTLPDAARVLEIGCGTGAIARMLAQRPEIGEVVRMDPLEPLLERARELAAGLTNLSFRPGRGEQLPVDDSSLDAVVIHTVPSHMPDPRSALREAHRVLVPGGWLAIFDGDYATITFATGDSDPLEACAAAFRMAHINDPSVMRRAVAMIDDAGFVGPQLTSHGYAQVVEPAYMLWVLGRGAEVLVTEGVIGPALADSLQAEARRRVSQGSFFGQVTYISVVALRGF